MKRCGKGKGCGSSCISKIDTCRVSLSVKTSEGVRRMTRVLDSQGDKSLIGQLFGKRPETNLPASEDDLILDDISRLLKGEEPLHIPLTREQKSKGSGEVTRLQAALKMGDLTRQEVGRDWQVLKDEALRRKDELRKEIKKQRVLGTAKAKAKEKELQSELDDLNAALKVGDGQKQPVSSSTKDARLNAKYFDESFSPQRTVSGKQSDYSWETNARQGTNGKKGGFGSVLFEGDLVVKRGDLGEKELDILKKVGEAGIGPELIYGELGKRRETFASIGIHEGRVAMSRVTGTEIGKFSGPDEKIGNTTVGDAYWKGRAILHRLGVAHNDAHGDNILLDKDGSPRFVDFGISQDNPKAALSEALGALTSRQTLPLGAVIPGGMKRDIQAMKVPVSGINSPPGERPANLKRMLSNLSQVKSYMKSLGMSNDEIAQVMASGIRNPESFYNKGAWGRLTNSQSLKIIGILYNGI